jgi:sodium transport system ATP-binding protein
MIRVESITKSFKAVQALRGVSFTAADGHITGLLGPNGAGKSTALRILCTVLQADSGQAWIDDINVREHPLKARRRLGVLPHGAGLYPQLSARENVLYYGRLHGLSETKLARRVDELIAELGMEAFAERPAKGFSQGQRTKVALARALVHEPRNLLLDEPTNGLDVMATRALRDTIRALKAAGHCVLLSSHIMQEVAALCDDIVIIAAGQVVAAGTPAALAQQSSSGDLEDTFVEAVTAAGAAS